MEFIRFPNTNCIGLIGHASQGFPELNSDCIVANFEAFVPHCFGKATPTYPCSLVLPKKNIREYGGH